MLQVLVCWLAFSISFACQPIIVIAMSVWSFSEGFQIFFWKVRPHPAVIEVLSWDLIITRLMKPIPNAVLGRLTSLSKDQFHHLIFNTSLIWVENCVITLHSRRFRFLSSKTTEELSFWFKNFFFTISQTWFSYS